MNEPLFRSLTENECYARYGFNKSDMEDLFNEGKGLKYNFANDATCEKESKK